jgi:hypothetical protein
LQWYVDPRESRPSGEKRRGEQAGVDGCCICPVDGALKPGARRRSRILQTICQGCPQPGARGIVQSGLCRRPARRSLVDGFCGSLRMVSRRFHRCRGHRKRRPHAGFERLRRPMIQARGAIVRKRSNRHDGRTNMTCRRGCSRSGLCRLQGGVKLWTDLCIDKCHAAGQAGH